MAKKLICQQCEEENEISSIFCRDCGAKLDHRNLQPDELVVKTRESSGSLRKLLGTVRLLVGLALLAAVGLGFWPTIPIGEVGTRDHAKEMLDKLERLHEATENGVRYSEVVGEKEINAYVRGRIDKQREERPRGGGVLANLEEVNIALYNNEIVVHIRNKLGPVPVVYMLKGRPIADRGSFSLGIEEASVGHLPLPGPLQGFVAGKLKAIFENLKPERKVLDNLERLQIMPRRARMITRGA